METEVHVGCSSGGVRKKIGALGLALAIIGLCAGKSMAGDLMAQPTQGLNVTGATTSVLPQTPAGGAAAEESWLSGFHVSGFLSQTFGMWQNPSNLRQLTTSRNSLAVSRTWLQVDENLRLNENNSLFMREWFVYEPPYAFNSANGFGKYSNEFYNQYNIRDAWWQNKTGPLTTYVGNQIVVWGQSLAFRVGDVVNPVDTTWAFGFANLEQSRIPQWMVHPILNLPQFGPFQSNFLEGILIPRLQPMWNSCNYADHRYDGECNVNAGSVNNGFPGGVAFDPAGRFSVHLDTDRYYPGRTAIVPGTSILPPYGQPMQNGRVILSGISAPFFYCTNLGSGGQPFNPVPVGMQKPCHMLGNGSATDVGQWKVPASTVANWDEGLRYHTLVGGAELTAFYFNTWSGYPNAYWQQYTNQFRLRFVPLQKMGVTGDMPIPMPSALSEYLPIVGRAEGVYTNHSAAFTYDYVGHPNLVRYTDMLSWMLALDIDQAYAPWLTKTGNLSANLEVYDEIALDGSQSMTETIGPYNGGGPGGNQTNLKNNVSALLNVGTSWMWNDIEPAWTMVFNPKGRTFLLFPSVVLNPPWTKKYFMKLQAIEILSGDKFAQQAGGCLKGQSMLTAQFQYNFNVL